MNKSIKYLLSITILLISIGLNIRPKNQFVTQKNNAQTFVVVGSSASGQAAVHELSSLIKKGTLSAATRIIWISAEKNQPYDRTGLADYISAEKNLFKDKKQDDSISCLFDTRVTKINKDQKTLVLDNDQTIAYDKLFLGLGTTPSFLDIPGIQSKGVHQFFTFDNAIAIKSYLNKQCQQHAVILGGGLCALECADALNKCGIDVTVVTKSCHVLNRKISNSDAVFIENAMLKNGVKHYPNATVAKVIETNGTITGVCLSNGSTLPANIFIYAIGARPNTLLAKNAGLNLYNEGILVNDYMCSSDSCIYAAGDCAVVRDRITGSLINSEKWNDAKEQGKIAAQAMAGIFIQSYEGAVTGSFANIFEVRFAMSGPLTNSDDHEVVIYKKDDSYYKFLLKNDQLKGYFAFNVPRAKILTLRKALISQAVINPEELVESGFVRDVFSLLR